MIILGLKKLFTQSNYINFNNPIYDNKKEIIYYEVYPYTLCMYSKGPCTSFRNLDLKRQIIFRNYKMYKFKNNKKFYFLTRIKALNI